MSLIFIWYFSLFILQKQETPPVSFTEEYIELQLRKNILIVNGNYFFVNHTRNIISKEITYPFPVSITNIDSVHIFDNLQGRYLDFKKMPKEISFRITVPPYDTVRMNIHYRQKGIKDTVKYILTTTKNWGEPLKKAEFTFETEKTRKITSFSYPPDRTSITDKQKYFWSRKDFMPESDFIVILGKR